MKKVEIEILQKLLAEESPFVLFPGEERFLLATGRVTQFPAFQKIVNAGENVQDLMIPIDGTLRILNPNGLLGEESLIDVAGPGTLVGFPEVLHSGQYAYSIATDKATWVLAIPRASMLAFQKRFPQSTQIFSLLNSNLALLNFVKKLRQSNSSDETVQKILSVLSEMPLRSQRCDRLERLVWPGPGFIFLQDGRFDVLLRPPEEPRVIGSVETGGWSGGSYLAREVTEFHWSLRAMRTSYFHFLPLQEVASLFSDELRSEFALESWEIANDIDFAEGAASKSHGNIVRARKLKNDIFEELGHRVDPTTLQLNSEPHQWYPTALRNICSLYNINFGTENFAYETYKRSSLSFGRCAELLERHGLVTRILKCNYKSLKSFSTPMLLHFQNKPCIFLGVKSGEVILYHPAAGPIAIEKNSFLEIWDHKALSVRHSEIEMALKEARTKNQLHDHNLIAELTFNFIFSAEKKKLRNLLGLAIFAQSFEAILPLFIERIIDNLLVSKSLPNFVSYLVGIGLFLVFIAIARFVRDAVSGAQMNALFLRARALFTRQLMQLPSNYYGESRSYDAFNRFQLLERLLHVRSSLEVNFMSTIAMAIVYLALIFWLSWPIGILCIVASVAVIYVRRFYMTRLTHGLHGIADLKREMRLTLGEQIISLIPIKSFKREKVFAQQAENSYFEHQKVLMSLERMGNLGGFISSLCLITLVVISLTLLTYQAFAGVVTAGAFLGIMMLLDRFWHPSYEIGNMMGEFRYVKVEELATSHMMRSDSEHSFMAREATKSTVLAGKIVFEHVTFRYSGSNVPVLSDVSFAIRPGQILAIVGMSGAGKSTIGRLIAGLVKPSAGRILFDDVDSRVLSPFSIRDQIGYVSQRSALYSGSIISNIALGDDQPDFARVVESARLAGATQFIEKLPGGFENHIEPSMGRFSEGQKMQICVARALYRDCKILVLDEVGAHLDPMLVRTIADNLALSNEPKTLIVITQRLASIKRLDKVLVLKNGFVIEEGSHAQLMKSEKEYAELFKTQVSGY